MKKILLGTLLALNLYSYQIQNADKDVVLYINKDDDHMSIGCGKDTSSDYRLKVCGGILTDKFKIDKPTLYMDSSTSIDEANDDIVLSVRVNLDRKVEEDVKFKFNTIEGSALKDEDFTEISDETYTISAGSTYIDISVTIKGKDIYELTESFKCKISSSSENASIDLDKDSTLVTINDDDDKPQVKIQDDVSENEDNDQVFTIKFNKELGIDTTVHLKVEHTDTEDGDFKDSKPFDEDVIVPKGTDSLDVTVKIEDDGDSEDDEDFNFKITDVDYATIEDGADKVGTIVDNDDGGMFSDERLKSDIKTLKGSLSKLMNINGVSFNWKRTGNIDIGLIAQNVQNEFPSAIIKDKNGFYKVRYYTLMGPIIEGIKELNKENKKLKVQNEMMKKSLKELQKDIDNIKKVLDFVQKNRDETKS